MQRCSRAHAGTRRRLRALIACYSRIHNALDEVGVFHTGLGSGVGHVVSVANERVRVCFQQPDPPVSSNPEIEPGVVAQPEGSVGGAAGVQDPLPYRARQGTGQHISNALPLAVRFIPLGKLGGYPLLWTSFSFVEHHLSYRQDLQFFVIPDDPDVQLAPVNEFLCYGALLEGVSGKGDWPP